MQKYKEEKQIKPFKEEIADAGYAQCGHNFLCFRHTEEKCRTYQLILSSTVSILKILKSHLTVWKSL